MFRISLNPVLILEMISPANESQQDVYFVYTLNERVAGLGRGQPVIVIHALQSAARFRKFFLPAGKKYLTSQKTIC